MATEEPSRGKLSKLVTHHVLADENKHVAPAVMHSNGVAYKLRKDGGRTRPGLDHLALALAGNLFISL